MTSAGHYSGSQGVGITRKEMLKLSLLGSAALALPLERVARTQLAVADRLPESQIPAPFQTQFVIPPVAQPVHRDATTDYYRMTMKQGSLEILPGLKTEVWGYDGITPGPTIRAQRGRNVVVRHVNQISNPRHEHTSVHLHGNASLPQYDGWANDTTRPGEYKDYRYPNNQDARTLWYHDHGVHHTAENAYMGCAAFYISHDEHEMSLPIPHGKYDVPVVLRDAIFGTDGSLIFDDQGHSSLFGDVILANGVPWPVMKVERRKYRFRFLNAAISRGFNLKLSSGEPLTIIGHDGGLAPAPVDVDSFRIGMAERYEVVIDFSKYAVGQQVVLQNRDLPNNPDLANTDRVMRFDVVSDATDISNNEVPEVLSNSTHPYNPMNLQEQQAVRTRRFRFERDNGLWTINGSIWDPNRVDANPGLNDVEIWEFTNKSGGWFHPIHVHLIDFKILSRNGAAPYPWERGPKDVVYVGEGETVRVLAKFGPHRGKYMIHCHNLVHEDHDMMTHFEVGAGGPHPSEEDPAKLLPEGPLWEDDPEETTGLEETTSEPTVPVNRAPVISALRPANNARIRDRTPTVTAAVSDVESKLSTSSIKLFLDGRRIGKFTFKRGRISYTSKALRLGWHTVKVIATDEQGRSTTRSWRFRVVLR